MPSNCSEPGETPTPDKSRQVLPQLPEQYERRAPEPGPSFYNSLSLHPLQSKHVQPRENSGQKARIRDLLYGIQAT
jgi:hypothetical protein